MSAVMQQQSFEERLMGKIKDSIGELMTPEDLKKIVDRGIEQALFKPRVIESQGYGGPQHKPPMVQEIVERFLTAHIRDAVDIWIAANEDKLLPLVAKVIQEGAGNAVLVALTSKLDWDFQQMGQSIMNKLTSRS